MQRPCDYWKEGVRLFTLKPFVIFTMRIGGEFMLSGVLSYGIVMRTCVCVCTCVLGGVGGGETGVKINQNEDTPSEP